MAAADAAACLKKAKGVCGLCSGPINIMKIGWVYEGALLSSWSALLSVFSAGSTEVARDAGRVLTLFRASHTTA